MQGRRKNKGLLIYGNEMTDNRLSPDSATDTTDAAQYNAGKQVALAALWFILGLIMPHAVVYGGMAPFGISFAAAVPGAGALGAYVAVMIGYFLPGGAALPIKYIASLIAVMGIKWSFSGTKFIRSHPAFVPLTAFLAVEFTGFALIVINGFDLFSAILVLGEGFLCAGTAYFFSVAIELITERAGKKTSGALMIQEQAGAIMTGAIILMAASSISIQSITPGRIIAGIIVLLMAKCGREVGGSVAGIIIGTALALASPDRLYLTAAFALGGLTAGVFARFGKLASSGAFIVCGLIVFVNTGDSELIISGIYEILAASIIFAVLPSSIDRAINRFFLHAQDIPAVEGLRRSVVMRLDHTAGAMAEVADTVDTVSKKLSGLSAPDLGSVYRSVSENICAVCGLRLYCWERAFDDTMSAFNSLTPILRQHGAVRAESLASRLPRQCSRLDDVTAKINAEYAAFTVRESAFRRLGELRGIVTDQFTGMSELLTELSDGFSGTERVDTDTALRVINACEEFGLIIRDAVCLIGRGGYMTVEILAIDEGVRIPKEKWIAAMSDACGRELSPPTVSRYGSSGDANTGILNSNSVKITLTEKPEFSITIGSSQLRCAGERLCGDSYDSFADGMGRWYAILSDGMGSGGRAAVDGAMTTALATRMIRAGMGYDSVLRMVNSAMMVKSSDESLATLDIVEIDLYNGHLRCLKAGAAPSLICSRGRVSRIDKTSLPIGILRDIHGEITEDVLVSGDILVMFSDGAITTGIEWIEDILCSLPSDASMQHIAEELAISANKAQKSRSDDITVLAIKLQKAE